MDVLKQDLSMTYDIKERATSLETKIEFDIFIRHVEVNEVKSTLTIYGWIKWVGIIAILHENTLLIMPFQNWVDDKLQWNASSYENITSVTGTPMEFWYPQLDLLNSLEGSEISSDGLIVIQSNGSADFQNNFQLTTYFGMNMALWPSDSHKCNFEFETRFNPLITVKMHYFGEEKFASDFVNSEWRVNGVSFGRAFWESKKNLILLSLQILRQGQSYRLTLIGPATVIILMTLAGFWLPVQSSEKILLNGIVCILITILMLYFGNKLPNMGIHTPLVIQFCSFTFYMTSISIIISIIVLAIARTEHIFGLPWSIKRALESRGGRWLMFHPIFYKSSRGLDKQHGEARAVEIQVAEEEEENDYDDIQTQSEANSVENEEPKARSIQEDWILLATAIDRIAFLAYSLIFIVIAIIYHV